MGYVSNMKILAIGLGNPYINKIQKTNNITGNYSTPAVTKSYAPDSVSFGRVAENAEKMRTLFKYGVIDIHTGQYVIDPDWFQELLQNGLFNRSIQTVVKTLKPIEDRLHKVERELFTKIEEFSKTHPLYRLDDVIQTLAPQAQEQLLKIQRPILDDLKTLGKKLPSEQKIAFEELMKTTEQQLNNQPILYKFSKKEFRYQLERIAQGIKKRGITDEIKTVDKLIKMSEGLPYLPSGRNFNRRKPKFNAEKSLGQANMIRQMDNYFARSSLKEDKELKDLFVNAKKQVFNIPMVVPFKVKTFTHDLQSITDSLNDKKLAKEDSIRYKKLAREIMKKASKLPTAQEELSAFIMKSSRNSSVKIGYDLLNGSVGAIDHLEPFSHGGADSLENYAFTTNAMNSKRGDKVISRWVKENPQTYEGSQKCVDRLLELYYNGTFAKEELTPWYIVNFVRRMKKLSPPDKPIILDMGNLLQEIKK